MTIRELHSLAYTRLPKREVHGRLHDMAATLNRSSLKECTAAELAELALHVRQLPVQPRTGPDGPRGDAYGPRERWGGKRTDETLKRSRRGTRGNPALKMISPRQRAFIAALLEELEFQPSTWLRKYFAVDSIEALATSRNAQEAIKRLLTIKAEKKQ